MNEQKKYKEWYSEDQCALAQYPSRKKTITAYAGNIKEAISCYVSKNKKNDYTILDAGCGDGVILKELSQMQHVQLYGIDNNPVRIERCKQFIDNVSVRDILSPGFPDSFFDVVILNHVLEHIQSDENVLKEMHRIIKPQGIILVNVPNEGCLMARLRNHFFQPWIMKETDHVHFYVRKEIEEKLSKTGFAIITFKPYGFFVPYTRFYELCSRYALCTWLLNGLGIIWPQQAASLFFVAQKKNG